MRKKKSFTSKFVEQVCSYPRKVKNIFPTACIEKKNHDLKETSNCPVANVITAIELVITIISSNVLTYFVICYYYYFFRGGGGGLAIIYSNYLYYQTLLT